MVNLLFWLVWLMGDLEVSVSLVYLVSRVDWRHADLTLKMLSRPYYVGNWRNFDMGWSVCYTIKFCVSQLSQSIGSLTIWIKPVKGCH